MQSTCFSGMLTYAPVGKYSGVVQLGCFQVFEGPPHQFIVTRLVFLPAVLRRFHFALVYQRICLHDTVVLTSKKWNLNVVLNCINMMVNVSTGLQFLINLITSSTPTVEQLLSCPVLCLVLHDITKVILRMLLQNSCSCYILYSQSPQLYGEIIEVILPLSVSISRV